MMHGQQNIQKKKLTTFQRLTLSPGTSFSYLRGSAKK